MKNLWTFSKLIKKYDILQMQKAFYTQQKFNSVSVVCEDIIYKHLHMRTIEYKKYKKFMYEKMQMKTVKDKLQEC